MEIVATNLNYNKKQKQIKRNKKQVKAIGLDCKSNTTIATKSRRFITSSET